MLFTFARSHRGKRVDSLLDYAYQNKPFYFTRCCEKKRCVCHYSHVLRSHFRLTWPVCQDRLSICLNCLSFLLGTLRHFTKRSSGCSSLPRGSSPQTLSCWYFVYSTLRIQRTNSFPHVRQRGSSAPARWHNRILLRSASLMSCRIFVLLTGLG